MVEYSDDDLKRATGIVEGLRVDSERPLEDLVEHPLVDREDGLSVIDLQWHFIQFYDDLRLVADFGLNFPAVRLTGEGVVPIALSELGRVPPYFRDYLYRRSIRFRERLREELRRTVRRFGDAATTLSPPEAETTFLSRASKFLAS